MPSKDARASPRPKMPKHRGGGNPRSDPRDVALGLLLFRCFVRFPTEPLPLPFFSFPSPSPSPPSCEERRHGVVVMILQEGTTTRKPQLKDVTHCHYTGALEGSNIFDGSVTCGKPLTFVIGIALPSRGVGTRPVPPGPPPDLADPIGSLVGAERRHLTLISPSASQGIAQLTLGSKEASLAPPTMGMGRQDHRPESRQTRPWSSRWSCCRSETRRPPGAQAARCNRGSGRARFCVRKAVAYVHTPSFGRVSTDLEVVDVTAPRPTVEIGELRGRVG